MAEERHTREFALPTVVRFADGVEHAAQSLRTSAAGGERRYAALHTGTTGSGYGGRFSEAARGAGMEIDELIVEPTLARVDAAVVWVGERRPDVILGIGGGRATDFGKYVAALSSRRFVCVPTQAASDGICSPVAVLVGDDGRPRSLAARMPFGIVIDWGVLRGASDRSWLAGAGDLISNLSAIRDWQLAAARGVEVIDDLACVTSEAAALSIIEERPDVPSVVFREKLLRGLILSGIAMEMAGSSRPASGSEHLISHALDGLLPTVRPHGLQVAMGSVASSVLRGDDPTDLLAFLRQLGLPTRPADLDIDWATFEQAVRLGPSMRPGRWTILSDLDEPRIAALRERYRDEGWVTVR